MKTLVGNNITPLLRCCSMLHKRTLQALGHEQKQHVLRALHSFDLHYLDVLQMCNPVWPVCRSVRRLAPAYRTGRASSCQLSLSLETSDSASTCSEVADAPVRFLLQTETELARMKATEYRRFLCNHIAVACNGLAQPWSPRFLFSSWEEAAIIMRFIYHLPEDIQVCNFIPNRLGLVTIRAVSMFEVLATEGSVGAGQLLEEIPPHLHILSFTLSISWKARHDVLNCLPCFL